MGSQLPLSTALTHTGDIFLIRIGDFARMTRKLSLRIVFPASLLLCAAQPVAAGPDPLVVTQLPDPDPGYVPPPPEKKARHAARKADEDSPTLEQAFENLGRVAGQVAELEEQRKGEPGEGPTKARFDPSEIHAKAQEAAERAQREAGGGY